MNLTKDIIAILVVIGAIASLFFVVNEVGARLLQTLAGAVFGFYYGTKEIPLSGIFKKK